MINAEGLALLKTYEGLRLKAYPDPGSKDGKPWTIGYGHTRGVRRGETITAAEAEAFLLEDLAATYDVIKKYVTTPLNDNQYSALCVFVYNIGEDQFRKSSVLKYINSVRFSEVPGRMALYRMNDGKVLEGLVRRRAAEGILWMKPAGTVAEAKKEVAKDVKDASGTIATPANPKKPWDWGAVGALMTALAGMSDEAKKLIGNVTTAVGVPPVYLLIAVGVGFAAWTFYNKWKEN